MRTPTHRTHPISAEVHLHGLLEHNFSVASVPDPSTVSSHGDAVVVNAGIGVAPAGIELAIESDVALCGKQRSERRGS